MCYRLQGLDDYEALDRLDRLIVFETFIKELEKEYYDQEELDEAKQKRQDRKNRDVFKQLLQRHVDEGRIHAKTRFSFTKNDF